MGIEIDEIRSLGGGSKSNVWNQIKSDILGVEMATVNTKEAATLGAAILAGKAIGCFDSVEKAVDGMTSIKTKYSPDKKESEIYQKNFDMYKLIFSSLEQCFEKGTR